MARIIVGRGKKHTIYRDDTHPAGQYVAEFTVHDQHYHDGTNWQAVEESYTTDGADGFTWKADRMNHKIRMDNGGGRRWYPRRNVAGEYITIGKPQYWTGKRWQAFTFASRRVSDNKITLVTNQNVTITISSKWNGIKADFVLENASAPLRMRYAAALTGLTYIDGKLYSGEEMIGTLAPGIAWDAEGKDLPITSSFSDGYVEFTVDPTLAVYPLTADPDFSCGSADGYVNGKSNIYSTSRTTSAGSVVNNAELRVGQIFDFRQESYYTYRSYLVFDTSAIGSGNPVTQVNLKLVCTTDNSATDFDVQIVKQDWSSQNPITSSNREAAYDNCLSGTADDDKWRNTSGMSTNTQYTSGNLSTAWVNVTGSTYYSLRSKRDYDGTSPSGFENEYIILAASEHGTSSYRPVLTVTYSASSSLPPQRMMTGFGA